MSAEIARIERLEKELSLKQLQIKSLLTITQAINENVSAIGLYRMYKNFLSWEMGISKMALFIKDENLWSCAAGIDVEENFLKGKMEKLLLQYNRLHTIKIVDDIALQEFDILIPVRHKNESIAYALIGGLNEQDDLYNRVQFITTITNIIAVAIENKRLFKKQIDQERFKREVELAAEVQNMLIPEKLPQSKYYDLSKIYKPHYNVGGDYIDCIKFSEDRFAFCIADISGKGVAAALLMANFQAVIQSLIFQYRDLETFVFALNQTVFRITKSDKYITFFIGEVNLTNNTLKYINAGHQPPVYFCGGKSRLLDKGTTVIGAFENLPFLENETIEIEPGCMIFSYTDGLTDLKNEKNQYFDERRVENFLINNAFLTATKFNEKLLIEIENFKGEESYSDDIAILTCKINYRNDKK